MRMLVSGTSERLGKQFAELSSAGDDLLRWIPPDQFVRQVSSPDTETPVERAIWLYHPPWSQGFVGSLAESGSNAAESLEIWEHANRTALNARSGARIPLIYINADRLASDREAQGSTHSNGAAADSGASPAAIWPAGTEALGWLADGTMPQLWDVFEALEAVAQCPTAGKPIFRHLCRPDEAAFATLMQWVCDGQQAGPLREEIQRLRRDLGDRANELADEHGKHVEAGNALALLRNENERVRHDLAERSSELAGERERHSEAVAELVKARGESKRLQDDLAARTSALAEEQRKHTEARSESELLLIQLHQVQEELEQYYLKNVDLSKDLEAGGKAAEAARKDVAILKADLAKSGKEGQAFKSQLASARNQNETLKSRVAQLQMELEDAFAPPVVRASADDKAQKGADPLRKAALRARHWRRERALHARIRQSGWFDAEWYLKTYPEVRAAHIDPVRHYLSVGWHERRNPCPKFDTAFYLRSNPDVRKEGINPLLHFLEHGMAERRPPKPPRP